MFFNIKQGQFSASKTETLNAVAKTMPPAYEEYGKSYYFDHVNTADKTERYKIDGFVATDTLVDIGNGLFQLEREIRYVGQWQRTVKFITEVVALFHPNRYLIPCVMYNGNEWGDGKEPKGLVKDGQPWVFSYDRTGIPSCSITETKEQFVALFASDADASSLESAVSVEKNPDGTFSQKIYYPVTEAPYTYARHNMFAPRRDNYITLKKGEVFRTRAYILVGKPKWENFAAANVEDAALEVFPFYKNPVMTVDDVWEKGINFARRLINECDGKKLIITGMKNDDDRMAIGYNVRHFEIGWCGQNILNCRLFICEYFRTKEKKLLDDAFEILDNWCEKQSDNGLVLAHYEWYNGGKKWKGGAYKEKQLCSTSTINTGWYPECCNMGWAIAEFARVYDLLKSNGIDKPRYLEFAVRAGEFFLEKYSDKHGFGKAWGFDGRCVDDSGTIGGFVMMGLWELYKVTKEEKWLECVKKAFAFYMKRDVDNFVCTAGAIDCECIDKETAYPLVQTGLALYELTKDEYYLTAAEKAAYYFFSWAYHYDALYDDDSDFTRYGYYTAGGTFVSVQHHAIDSWGSLLVCEFLRLAKYTGDERWEKRAYMMWCNAILCITQREGDVVNGLARPLGSQNEAFFNCVWAKYRPNSDQRGHFNDWLVSWVNAYRLYTINDLRTNGVNWERVGVHANGGYWPKKK